jgi:hypothetical protein
MDAKLIYALAFRQHLFSLAVCATVHGPEWAEPARVPHVRFRTPP